MELLLIVCPSIACFGSMNFFHHGFTKPYVLNSYPGPCFNVCRQRSVLTVHVILPFNLIQQCFLHSGY